MSKLFSCLAEENEKKGTNQCCYTNGLNNISKTSQPKIRVQFLVIILSHGTITKIVEKFSN